MRFFSKSFLSLLIKGKNIAFCLALIAVETHSYSLEREGFLASSFQRFSISVAVIGLFFIMAIIESYKILSRKK